MDVDTVKDRLAQEVERRADVLLEISHSIHEHPELCYEEHHAHDLLAGVLEDEGFDVERGAARHGHRVRGQGRHRRRPDRRRLL